VRLQQILVTVRRVLSELHVPIGPLAGMVYGWLDSHFSSAFWITDSLNKHMKPF